MENVSQVFSASVDLLFLAWPTIPDDAFLGETEEVDKYTSRLAQSKIEELNSILTTSALLAGIVAAVYSWPSFATSPWPAKTLFGASFILSIMSVRKAMQLNYIMRRLACAGIGTEAGEKIRNQLAKKNLNGDWIPSRGRQTIWNGATLFLNLAIITLVLGYAWMIVGAAHRVGWEWAEDDTKIAVVLLTVGLLSFSHWAVAGMMTYSRYKAPPPPVATMSSTTTATTSKEPLPTSRSSTAYDPLNHSLMPSSSNNLGLHHRTSPAKNDSGSASFIQV